RRRVLPVSRSPLIIASTPSRKSASAKLLSHLTCCCTSSLNFFVFAIVFLDSLAAPLALLVVLPICASCLDIAAILLFGAPGQQDHQFCPVQPEINSVPWPKVDPIFEHAAPNPFRI